MIRWALESCRKYNIHIIMYWFFVWLISFDYYLLRIGMHRWIKTDCTHCYGKLHNNSIVFQSLSLSVISHWRCQHTYMNMFSFVSFTRRENTFRALCDNGPVVVVLGSWFVCGINALINIIGLGQNDIHVFLDCSNVKMLICWSLQINNNVCVDKGQKKCTNMHFGILRRWKHRNYSYSL